MTMCSLSVFVEAAILIMYWISCVHQNVFNRLQHYRHLAVVMPDGYQKTANQSVRRIVAK